MKKTLLILPFACMLFSFLNAQPVNDEPCNAISLPVTANLEECTPGQPIQWSAATASAVPNPVCGSGQLIDVWYKFTAPANGKVNIRTSLPAGATNDGAMAVYGAVSCSGPFTEIDCNDDYTGLNPGLTITGLTAAQTYYIRFWSLGQVTGNYLICISNPAPPPPPIDPDKRIGINYDFPEANLDINGTVIIRGGNPQTGKVLTATSNTGKVEWKSPTANQKLLKVRKTSDQALPQYTETRILFPTTVYAIGNSFSNNAYTISDSAGSIYEFTLTLSFTRRQEGSNLFIYVYQNGVKVQTIVHSNYEAVTGLYVGWTDNFTIQCLSPETEVYLTIYNDSCCQSIIDNINGNSFLMAKKIY